MLSAFAFGFWVSAICGGMWLVSSLLCEFYPLLPPHLPLLFLLLLLVLVRVVVNVNVVIVSKRGNCKGNSALGKVVLLLFLENVCPGNCCKKNYGIVLKETLKRVIRVSNWEKGLAKRAEKENARKVTESD